MPDIRQMNRQAARRHQNDVDPHILAIFAIFRVEYLGSVRDPLQAALVDRRGKIRQPGPRLDLDKGDQPASSRDQIHFAARRPHPLRQYPPAVQPQPAGSGLFRSPPLSLGLGAIHDIARDLGGETILHLSIIKIPSVIRRSLPVSFAKL